MGVPFKPWFLPKYAAVLQKNLLPKDGYIDTKELPMNVVKKIEYTLPKPKETNKKKASHSSRQNKDSSREGSFSTFFQEPSVGKKRKKIATLPLNVKKKQ